MSAVLTRSPSPAEHDAAGAAGAASPRGPGRDGQRSDGQRSAALGGAELTVAVVTLITAACLPLTRVFIGLGFLVPVLGVALLVLGLSWGCRRAALGPGLSLAATLGGWTAFMSAAYFRDTLAGGVLPTLATLSEGRELWLYGIELIRIRTAPAFAEPPLLFVTLTGVWAVAYAIDSLVFRGRAPIRAIAAATVLWAVPLVIQGAHGPVWPTAAALVFAAALVLRAHASQEISRWGQRVVAPGSATRSRPASGAPGGMAMTAMAIAAGALAATVLPGYGDPAWYDIRGIGRSTLTANPIVNIRSSLVASDDEPVLEVRSPRDVYLRITALDVYSEREEWINDGIRASPVTGQLRRLDPTGSSERVPVEVTVLDAAAGAVFAPVPFQPLRVEGPAGSRLQYDARLSTLVADTRDGMQPGDSYRVVSRIPAPSAEDLLAIDTLETGALTELPPNVPDEVRDLARQIVDDAGAVTPFEKVMAIQEELRTWNYSLSPPSGHSGRAMVSFLEHRTGYCEQFAGTMAVMLRTLDIPARVVVGYTPGTRADGETDVYRVAGSNLHAWPEVLFGDLGWIQFEPTPRSDGNILVPSMTSVAPLTTLSPTVALGGTLPQDIPFDISFIPGFGDIPVREAQGDSGGVLGGRAAARAARSLPGAAAAALLIAAAAVGLRARKRVLVAGLGPAERALRVRDRLDRVGRGVGIRAAAFETDAEYLRRLTGDHPRSAQVAGHIARARYAREMTEAAAAAAEAGGSVLEHDLLDGLTRRARAAARLRARASIARETMMDLARRLRRLPRPGER